MDLKLVEYLVLASETGSFVKAAARLGMAQPSFGRQIVKLEQECGARLLYRHGRGVTLTPEGERFLEGIAPVMQQIGSLKANLVNEPRPRGKVIVGMTPTMVDQFGLTLIRAVRNNYPEVKLHIVCGMSAHVLEWLLEGGLDIALMHNPRRARQIIADVLVREELFLVSVAGGDAPKPKKGAATLAELAALPLVLPTRKDGLRLMLEAACEKLEVDPNVVFEIDSLPLRKELILARQAHAVLPLAAVQKELAAGLVSVRPLQPRLEIKTVIAFAGKHAPTQAMLAVKEQVVLVFHGVEADAKCAARTRTRKKLQH